MSESETAFKSAEVTIQPTLHKIILDLKLIFRDKIALSLYLIHDVSKHSNSFPQAFKNTRICTQNEIN